MSSTQPITLSSLKFIRPQELASDLSDPKRAPSVAIIDVRDSDHVGGHIRNSQWVPTDQLDVRMAELLRVNKDKKRVVFHCMLSQQRGPKSALAYARAKAREVKRNQKDQGGRDESRSESDRAADVGGNIGGQEVCVLEGGFGQWQARYGEDERLTEGWVKDVWE